jgi:acyl carrier protein
MKQPGVIRTRNIAQIWRDLLGLEDVEEDADFFSLGGDSMLAIRMLVEVTSIVCHEIDYDQFFTEPTLKTLRRLIESNPEAGTEPVAQ